ncbi:MAG: hypothetical protein KF777_16355 [Planctomycetaceae bacterium]|nr:hypothetical protein [Planctomycetaceae bacterium]
MNDEQLQQAWQSQPAEMSSVGDIDATLIQLRQQQDKFQKQIFWRDVREIGTGILLIPVWIAMGVQGSLPVTWYLAVPAMLWIAGYLLYQRRAARHLELQPGASLRDSLVASIAQLDHQIRLLRTVFWWYLLPILIALVAFFAQCLWQDRAGGPMAFVAFGLVMTICAIVFGGVYWLNQSAVRRSLQPRREELAAQLASLDEAGSPDV